MKRWIISRLELMKIKKRAMRHGAWFKTLERIDRVIINLTIQCIEKIRSPKLSEIVTAILNKLKQKLESPIKILMKQVGLFLAQRISQIAQSWGNRKTAPWAKEYGFIRFLTITYMNTPVIFRMQRRFGRSEKINLQY